MKKNQDVLQHGGPIGSDVTWAQRHAMVRRFVAVRSFPLAMPAAKQQIHKVPFLRGEAIAAAHASHNFRPMRAIY